MIPYGKQHIDEDDIAAVVETLKSGWITQGPKIAAFEQSLAQYCGARYAVATNSGTSALHLAYLAAGLGRGDEVITTPNTFAATTNMLLAVGAKPVFADIRHDTSNINEVKIEHLITRRTKAIIPVHFGGHPCEMKAINKIAKKHKLKVIEDACHALGASYGGQKIGRISDLSIFSFHPVKSITTGEGGAILTNNRALYEKMVSLRSHGITKDKQGTNVMRELGYNYRMNDIQASLGLSQLKKLDRFIEKRHRIVSGYEKNLRGFDPIILPQELLGSYSSWHLYVIRTKNPADRDGLREYLKQAGIGVNFHYPAVYRHPYYRENGYRKTSLPNMEQYHASAITIPCYPDLKKEEIKYVSDKIKEYFRKKIR